MPVLALLACGCVGAQVSVTVKANGPVTVRTGSAEFEVLPDGYVRGYLLVGGERLTLDDPAGAGEAVRIDGRPIENFAIDYARIRTSITGTGGKRIEIPARAGSLARTMTLEAGGRFPGMLASTVAYKNVGTAPVRLDQVTTAQHRINASLMDPQAQPFELWSFQGSSSRWGQDDVVKLTARFSRANLMGVNLPNGLGGGVPVAAFWTGRAGMAIGHLDTLPLALSLPVEVGDDQRPRVALRLDPAVVLKPGDSFATPRTFLMVYKGDFYEPLRMYSAALQAGGWKLPKPTSEDYEISWCGWGYEFNVTAKEMLGVIPKLREFHIKWATLDDRWFDTYGDWNPRADTFPGDSIRQMVKEYHRNGILAQIWWLPLGAEIPGQKYSSHAYIESKVVKEHPDWLVLDMDGKPAMTVRNLATLCPALPEVREYYRQLTERFIRDWGFDGNKLDNIYSAPACYNPKHHHKSPYDSVNAVGDIYRVIFDTTRRLKPASVTQLCPCGTPPNIAWLPYMDQAVTADPTSSAQVRRRIKMYKALMGPRAPVYGDHVELTESMRRGGRQVNIGDDFASTVGLGGVIGTKFVWPQTDARYQREALTPEKNLLWKKWTDIFHEKMLPSGDFLNLYTIGYDSPEGYVVRKGGHAYYAFFAGYPDESWKGEVELRGLTPGRYSVFDYPGNRNLGVVDARNPRVAAEFTGSLLLEVTRQ